MKWMTQISTPLDIPEMGDKSEYICLGSCFAGHLHTYLAQYKLDGICNPFGITYDPLSIARQLEWASDGLDLNDAHLIEKEGYWSHLDVHSDANRPTAKELTEYLNHQTSLLRDRIEKSELVIITLGSAWAFKYLETDTLITNCHGIPGARFSKELISFADVVKSLDRIISALKRITTEIKIVFTVSPVRHIRYGLVANNRSKSILLTAVHQCIDNEADAHYFPAYEVLVDELRDYRFYKRDLVHPTDLAVEQVVDYWREYSFSEPLRHRVKEIDFINRLLLHRPRFPKSVSYRAHLLKSEERIARAESDYKNLDWSSERRQLELLQSKAR